MYQVYGIPIMGFIDINGISENDICTTDYEVRNINIKINNIDNTSINVEIEYGICCIAYEEREINVIEDIYSPKEEIIVKQEKASLIRNKNSVKDVCTVKSLISIPELKNNKIYMTKVSTFVVKTNAMNNMVTYEGELDVDILYESNVAKQIDVRSEKIPFTHQVNSDLIGKDSLLDLDIEITSKDYEIRSDSSVSLNVNLEFLIDVSQREDVNIVSDIKVEPIPEERNQSSSLVVYYVKEGDTLWKIAKRFRSTVDEIASVNSIENVEKLSIGEQLYIPKFNF